MRVGTRSESAQPVLPAHETAPQVTAWEVSAREILADTGIRMDALHFNRPAKEALDSIRAQGIDLTPLSEWADVVWPDWYSRIMADSPDYGLPYVNAQELLRILSLAVEPQAMRFISKASEVDLKTVALRRDTLLLTRSGTIGRVFYVSRLMEGWIATDDLLRINPHQPATAGFLYSWFRQPPAQKQILAHTYGGQINHVTDEQIATVLVPCLPDEAIAHIDAGVRKAVQMRDAALTALIDSWSV